MLYAGGDRCFGLSTLVYAPGPGVVELAPSTVEPNFSRARIVYCGARFIVDTLDVPMGAVL